MKRKRYSVEQIVVAVKQHEMGLPAGDIARKLGIAGHPFRTLAVIDVFTRECLAVEPGHKFGAAEVVRLGPKLGGRSTGILTQRDEKRESL